MSFKRISCDCYSTWPALHLLYDLSIQCAIREQRTKAIMVLVQSPRGGDATCSHSTDAPQRSNRLQRVCRPVLCKRRQIRSKPRTDYQCGQTPLPLGSRPLHAVRLLRLVARRCRTFQTVILCLCYLREGLTPGACSKMVGNQGGKR